MQTDPNAEVIVGDKWNDINNGEYLLITSLVSFANCKDLEERKLTNPLHYILQQQYWKQITD